MICRLLSLIRRTIKRGEPPIRPKPTAFTSSTESQHMCSIIHALAHALHDRVPLSKRLIFAKGLSADKTKENLKARAAEMEQTALKIVID